jgi:XTP/dITP diphosphohydrolase
MDRLVVATANKSKFVEIKDIFKEVNLELFSLLDFSQRPKIIEDGKNFYENAKKKAQSAATFYNCISLGEDSGLEVQALNNRPGIYSARFAGSDSNSKKNIEKLLEMMKGIAWEKRQARFVCSLVLVFPGGREEYFSGRVEGFITDSPKGDSGFGYDPVFFLPALGKTMAEIPFSLKNKISHRQKAVSLAKNYFLKNKGFI